MTAPGQNRSVLIEQKISALPPKADMLVEFPALSLRSVADGLQSIDENIVGLNCFLDHLLADVEFVHPDAFEQPKTHLVERFRLVDGGKRLSLSFTWEDPAIYLKPHTYELTYYKSDPGTYAFEEYCHADDPAQGGSVIEPPQK